MWFNEFILALIFAVNSMVVFFIICSLIKKIKKYYVKRQIRKYVDKILGI